MGVLALGGAVVAVAGLTLIRSYPVMGDEDDPSKVRVPGRRSPQLERIVPAGQYVRSPQLWRALGLLALASAGVLWVLSGLSVTAESVVHQELDSGSLAGLIVALFAIGSVVGGVVWSVAADFWARNRLLRLSGSGTVVVLVLLSVLSFFSPAGGLGRGVLLSLAGLFLGGLGALIALTFIDYMGVRLLGTLSLAFGLLSGIGAAAGSLAAGFLVDASDAYQWWFLIGAPIITLAVLAATRAPYPVVGLEEQAATV